jgi:hypothetical protein
VTCTRVLTSVYQLNITEAGLTPGKMAEAAAEPIVAYSGRQLTVCVQLKPKKSRFLENRVADLWQTLRIVLYFASRQVSTLRVNYGRQLHCQLF